MVLQKKKTTVHYVDNSRFLKEILEYKKAVRKAKRLKQQEPRMTNYIGECILKIAQKLANKPCFMNYSFKEEMISDGIENCILYFKDYDPKIGTNPFAYFTQIIFYAFIRRINKEEKNRYIIYKNFQYTMILGSSSQAAGEHHDIISRFDDGENHLISSSLYDNINDFMSRFEEKEEAKKIKRKKVKQGRLKDL